MSWKTAEVPHSIAIQDYTTGTVDQSKNKMQHFQPGAAPARSGVSS